MFAAAMRVSQKARTVLLDSMCVFFETLPRLRSVKGWERKGKERGGRRVGSLKNTETVNNGIIQLRRFVRGRKEGGDTY